ncbi:hypothetical protein [Nitrosomonas sp.]|uniref:hypothetical protein n=1 Tax=Nitrosomonas sp. TaxID=42353 RepID=UPI00284765BE|nr:hypothetical protein [Nitrosomonas sp.]MDR4513638.1 hypothetical protein [Nitrosomonas sp.]
MSIVIEGNGNTTTGNGDQHESMRSKIWRIQTYIDWINRVEGLLSTLHASPSTKKMAIFFSLFLVVFPIVVFFYQLLLHYELIVSPALLVTFLSGILSVRASFKMEVQ